MTEAHRVLDRLGLETAPHHAEADADVDRFLFRQHTTPIDYRVYLSRLYGFLAPLEVSLAAASGLEEVIDLRERAKSPHLMADMLALDLTMQDIIELAQCPTIPSFEGVASALGWMYVAERAMLASAVIHRHLSTQMPCEMANASRYLSSYAGRIGTRWRELGEAMERVGQGDQIVSAAHDAFAALHRWRSEDLAATGRIRFAV